MVQYTSRGYRHVGAGPAIIQRCEDCGDDLINKSTKYPYKLGWICKHCKVKKEHGVVDPKTCFQGSVITMDD